MGDGGYLKQQDKNWQHCLMAYSHPKWSGYTWFFKIRVDQKIEKLTVKQYMPFIFGQREINTFQ